MPSAVPSDRPPLSVLVGVGMVAGVTLALQVLVTRLLSAAMVYHFSFLSISLALLGTGASGMLVYLRPGWFAGDRRDVLGRWAMLGAVLTAIAPFGLVRLDLTLGGEITAAFALHLGVACAIVALPFLAAGVVIALALQGYAGTVGRVYSADLLGAALGAAAVVPAMRLLPVPTLVVVAGIVLAAAAWVLARPGGSTRRGAGGLVAVALVASPLAAGGSRLHLPVRFNLPAGARELGERWTPISRVVGFEVGTDPLIGAVIYDRAYAPVMAYRRGEPFPDWRALRLGPQSIGYALTGPGRVLVIGGGGGRDILNALAAEQRDVTVVELNDGVRAMVDDELGYLSGAPYSLPSVRTIIGDGRSVLAGLPGSFDQIHISFTDTASANSAAAFALTENHLYTVEAFQEYFEHLSPRGILNVSRLYRLVGDEALRATVLTLEALRGLGVADPSRHVVVIRGRDFFDAPFGTILARRTPFTDDELAQVRALADVRGEGVAFAPGGPYFAEWADLARAESPAAFCRGHRLDVCAPTDDRPFFFDMKRWRDLGRPMAGYHYPIDPVMVLLATLGIQALLAGVVYVLPLLGGRVGPRPGFRVLRYFACIGFGFMSLEVALIQRAVLVLGYPTYALSVVLFALLLSSGAGSAMAAGWREPRGWVVWTLSGVSALALAAALGLPAVLGPVLAWPFPARMAGVIVLLLPFGVLMGTAMPVGLARAEGLAPGCLAYAWAVNGIASVVASTVAVVAALNFGFSGTMVMASACYALAALDAVRGPWPVRA